MAKKKSIANIAFMMEFVRKFIDSEMDRLEFDIDFNYHLIQRFNKMESENSEAAYAFAERISDLVDKSDDMDTEDLRDELCDGFDLVLDILNGVAY